MWYGLANPLESKNLNAADVVINECDLCFIIGTSSQVYPAASFGHIAISRGIPVVEVNPNPAVGNDDIITCPAKSGEFLPKVLEEFKFMSKN